MANKKLKTLKFPGLSDTYTIPQTADDLTYDASATYTANTVGSIVNTHTKQIESISQSVSSCKWTDDAVAKLKTFLENVVYIDNSTGQSAADELIKILTSTTPTTLLSIGASLTGTSISVGDTLTSSMFAVTAYYSDGSSKTVTDFTFNPTTATSTSTSVTISYGGKSTTVTVSATTPVELSSITATYTGGTIYKNATLTSSMFAVTANYSDGSSKTVTGFSFTPTTANTTPNTTVTISYGGKSTTVSVAVSTATVSAITITGYTLNNGVTRLYPNDIFTSKGTFKYTLAYTDGSTVTKTGNDDLTVSPTSFDSAKTAAVSVYYSAVTGVYATYNMTVSENPKVTTIGATYSKGTTLDVGTEMTVGLCTISHTSQYGDTMTTGYTKDYLGSSTGLEISSYTVVEGTQTVYVYCLTDDARTLSTTFTVTGKAVSSDYTISYDTKLSAGGTEYQQIDTSDAPTLASGETTVSLTSSFSKLASSMPNQYFTGSTTANYLNSSWTSERAPYIVTTGGATTSGSGSTTFTPTANVIVHAIPIVFLYGVSGYTTDTAAVASYNYAPINMMKNSTTHLSSWSTLLTNMWAIGNRTYTVTFGASAASYSMRIQFWKYDESNSVFQYAGEWKQSSKSANKTATFDANLSLPTGFTLYPSGTSAIDADYFSLCVSSVGGDTTANYETVSGDLSITFTEG